MAQRFDIGVNHDGRPICPACGQYLPEGELLRFLPGNGCLRVMLRTCVCGRETLTTEPCANVDIDDNPLRIEWVSGDGKWAIIGASPVDTDFADVLSNPVAELDYLWPEDDSVGYAFMDADGNIGWVVGPDEVEMPRDFLDEVSARLDAVRREVAA